MTPRIRRQDTGMSRSAGQSCQPTTPQTREGLAGLSTSPSGRSADYRIHRRRDLMPGQTRSGAPSAAGTTSGRSGDPKSWCRPGKGWAPGWCGRQRGSRRSRPVISRPSARASPSPRRFVQPRHGCALRPSGLQPTGNCGPCPRKATVGPRSPRSCRAPWPPRGSPAPDPTAGCPLAQCRHGQGRIHDALSRHHAPQSHLSRIMRDGGHSTTYDTRHGPRRSVTRGAAAVTPGDLGRAPPGNPRPCKAGRAPQT